MDLIPDLIRDGIECSVLLNAHGSMESVLTEMQVPYKIIPFLSDMKRKSVKTNITKQVANCWSLLAIRHYLRTRNIDVFHNNSLPVTIGMEAAKLEKIPYICHIRENIWAGLGNEFLHENRAKDLIREAFCTIVISDYIRNIYKKFERKANYLTLYDGIRVEDYYDKRQIFMSEWIRVAIIGVINPNKNQGEAIKAVEILHRRGYRNIELIVVGKIGKWHESTAYADHLIRHVSDNNLDYISFISPIEDLEELRLLRRTCDINLICSKAEGMGRTTIESMLSGALTIAANAGATPELLKDSETGLLYKSGNPEDLADRIAGALSNRKRAREIAENGQEYAFKRFGLKQYSDQIKELYRFACRKKEV